ncbi:taste receptor type 2 member 40-like [Mantella aurantiaca]
MSSAGKTLLTIIILLQAVIGIALNLYISSFSFMSPRNGPGFHPTTVIYFTMGLIHVFLQGVLTARNILYIFWPCFFFIKEFNLTFSMLTLSLAYCSFWLTGWLCVHYCVTIANLGHRWMIGLKRLLSSFLPHVLVLSFTGPGLMGVLSMWMVDVVFEVTPLTNLTGSACGNRSTFHLNAAYRAVSALLGCCLPFVLSLISASMTISSLIRHITKMKLNVSGYTRSNLQVLIRAARTMVLFLALSVLFYVFQLIFSATITSAYPEVIPVLSSFIIMSFPSAEAAVIIQAVPKLREKIWEKLRFKKESN